MVDDAPGLHPPFLFPASGYLFNTRHVLAMMNTRQARTAISLLLLTATGVSAQDPQPAPVSPAPAEEITYVIRPGDTLWDIAAAYLKDPFRWPEIFRRNTDVVENPHWIYPGERIRIAAAEIRDDAVAAAREGAPASAVISGNPSRTIFASGMAARDDASTFGGVIGRFDAPSARFGEIETAPYLDTLGGPRVHGRISGTVERFGIEAENQDRRFQLNDRVYVTAPGEARPGDRFYTYALGPTIGDRAQVLVPTGILLVDSIRAGGLVRARLVRQFAPVTASQRFLPFSTLPAPSGETAIPVSGGPTAKVVWVQNNPVLPSLQHYVVLDAAGLPRVSIGDLFTLVDPGGEEKSAGLANPPEDVGLVQVVRVTRFGVTAIVVDQSQPAIRAGMLARRTARIP